MQRKLNDDFDIDLELEAKESDHEILDESDDMSMAKNDVMEIIKKNVFDNDLEKNLLTAVERHFKKLKESPRYGPTDFGIPELNQTIWDTFHDYEDFVHDNRFENIDLVELGNIIRNYVTPEATEALRNRAISQFQ